MMTVLTTEQNFFYRFRKFNVVKFDRPSIVTIKQDYSGIKRFSPKITSSYNITICNKFKVIFTPNTIKYD